MRTTLKYELRQESMEKQHEAGRYNPATEIKFRGQLDEYFIHTLGCGTSHDIHVFKEDYLVVVLTINRAIEYVGIEVFDGSEKFGDLFLQRAYEEIEQVLGPQGLDLQPITMAKRMLAILC